MNKEDYEKAKQKCWRMLWREFFYDESKTQPVDREDVFNFTFNRAYRLGMETANNEQRPKSMYKVGDKVTVFYQTGNRIGFIKEILRSGFFNVDFGGGLVGRSIEEWKIKPYTEPQEDKHFDDIIKDRFCKERRLNIAAQITASMMQCAKHEDIPRIVRWSFEATDALLAEIEKGGAR